MSYQEMLDSLSLEEKCALLQGATTFGGRPNPRLGIPAVAFSDGPNGLRHQAGAADHLGLNGSEPATCFPHRGHGLQLLGPPTSARGSGTPWRRRPPSRA